MGNINPWDEPAQIRPIEKKARKAVEREYKHSPAFVIESKASEDGKLGRVDSVVNLYGIIDEGRDIVFPSFFAKSLAENGQRVRVLNSHSMKDGVLEVIGKPLAMREIGREELPPEVLSRFPEALGGLWTSTQFMLSDERSKAVFDRLNAGFIDEWSIGFDVLQSEQSRVKRVFNGSFWKYEKALPVDPPESLVLDDEGHPMIVRLLRQGRLWEYSPVIWGQNQGTFVESIKSSDPIPTDAKPYAVFPMNDEFCVFKVDENGERTGESLGCHATEDEANAQVAALYASEQDGKARKEYTPQGPQRRLGDCIMADMMDALNFIMGRQLRDGMMSGEEHGQMMGMCIEHVNAMRASMPDELAMRTMPDMPMFMFGADGATETKVGRVLSAANFGKIEQASTLLQEVLKAATSATDNEGTSGDKALEPVADNQDGPHETTETPTPDATGAGPSSDEAPAIDADSLLLRFQQLVGDISILEGKT